jgi:hypothetical protein
MSEYKPIEKLDYSFYKWIHTSKDLTDLCYVGSTANLASRKREHKSTCNNTNAKPYNNLLYTTMRENGGFENFKMVILGTAEQLTKREAQAIEEEYRKKEQATLNERRCYRTDEQKKQYIQEYHKDYKQEKLEYDKQYNQDHKVERTEYHNQYIQNNKAKVAEHTKRYYLKNKAKILEQKKQYYLNNKK